MKKYKTEYLDKWIIDHDLKITRLPKIIDGVEVNDHLISKLKGQWCLFDTKEEAEKMVKHINEIIDNPVGLRDEDILLLCYRFAIYDIKETRRNSQFCEADDYATSYFRFIKRVLYNRSPEDKHAENAKLLLESRGLIGFPVEVFYDMLIRQGFMVRIGSYCDSLLMPTYKGRMYGINKSATKEFCASHEKAFPLFYEDTFEALLKKIGITNYIKQHDSRYYLREDFNPERIESLKYNHEIEHFTLEMELAGNVFNSWEEADEASRKVKECLSGSTPEVDKNPTPEVDKNPTPESDEDLRMWCMEHPSRYLRFFDRYKLLSEAKGKDRELLKFCISHENSHSFRSLDEALEWIKTGVTPDWVPAMYEEFDKIASHKTKETNEIIP